MRLMYDSVDWNAIPRNAEMVAGYIDGGLYRWPEAAWDRFPNARRVRIARRTYTNDGHVLDVELGIPTVWPITNPSVRIGIRNWVQMRRDSGVEPTIYCNQLNDWQPIRGIFHEVGMREPYWWVARYNNVRDIPSGAIGKQFANPPLAGGHYDLSVMADYWPGVDPAPEPGPLPVWEQLEEEDGMKTYYVHGDDTGHMPPPHEETTWGDAVFLVEATADGLKRRHVSQDEWWAANAAGAKLSKHPQAWVDSIPWGATPGLFWWEPPTEDGGQ